jgi:hypothetical protein
MLDVVLTPDLTPALDLAKRLGWTGIVGINGKSEGVVQGSMRQGSLFVAIPFSEKSRQLIEQGQADCVYGFEAIAKRDSLHQRNSGLNDTVGPFMREKHVAYAIPFSMLLHGQNRPALMGRVMQNIEIARKLKLEICLGSFAEKPTDIRSPSDLSALAISLGMRPEEAKKALRFTEERVAINRKKQQKTYISEQLRLD